MKSLLVLLCPRFLPFLFPFYYAFFLDSHCCILPRSSSPPLRVLKNSHLPTLKPTLSFSLFLFSRRFLTSFSRKHLGFDSFESSGILGPNFHSIQKTSNLFKEEATTTISTTETEKTTTTTKATTMDPTSPHFLGALEYFIVTFVTLFLDSVIVEIYLFYILLISNFPSFLSFKIF